MQRKVTKAFKKSLLVLWKIMSTDLNCQQLLCFYAFFVVYGFSTKDNLYVSSVTFFLLLLLLMLMMNMTDTFLCSGQVGSMYLHAVYEKD